MTNEIHVTVRGNAAGDATLRTAADGKPWVTFRVGSSARRFDARQQEWTDGTTQWFDVKVFGRSAEHVGASVKKGSPILVRGVLVTESWQTKDGQDRSSMVIIADSVALEMSRGLTTYTRVEQSQSSRDQSGDGSAPALTGAGGDADAEAGAEAGAEGGAGAGADEDVEADGSGAAQHEEVAEALDALTDRSPAFA
ncbi:MAG: single-stranded DNA-binding protein [Actinomycetaceae bacterium]